MKARLFFSIMLIFFSSNLIAQTNGMVDDVQEIQAIRDLYDSTNGQGWVNNSGWPSTDIEWNAIVSVDQMASWYGVTAENGDIVSLKLDWNRLSGTLPPSIGNLSKLRYLNFGRNQIVGELPDTWSNLSSIEYMDLHFNRLSGTFPDSWASLTTLTHLNIGSNRITGSLPASWSSLTSLKWLSLGYNPIGGTLPESWSSLTSLDTLYLHWSGVGGKLPDSWASMTNLVFLDIDFMEFTGGLPESWSSMKNLKTVWLNSNHLTGDLPSSWSALTSLENLYLDNNDLSGTIPESWSSLIKLQKLFLYKNNLRGDLPSYLSTFQDLEYIKLDSNSFTSFPDFKNHPSPSQIKVEIFDNHLNFEVLEQNFIPAGTHIFSSFEYSPQKIFKDTIRSSPTTGTIHHIVINDRGGGSQTQYEWQEWDGNTWVPVAGASDENLTLDSLTLIDHARLFRCRMTNTLVANLEIYSSVFKIIMVEPPSVTDANVCPGQTATLIANGSGTINWFANEIGGVAFHTGSTFITSVLTDSITYYVSQTVDSVESERMAITAFVGPIFTVTQDTSLCQGESLPIVVEGNDLTVDWGIEMGIQNSFIARPDTTTTYTFSLEDEFGCTATGGVTVTVIEPVTADILPVVPVCAGDTSTLEASEVAGATYSWEPGGLTGQTVNVLVNELQQYTLTVTGPNGCTAEATTIPELKTVAVGSEDREICVADSVTLVAEGGDTYLWSTGETTPEITFNPTSPGVYDLSFTATRDGCSASDTVMVTVQEFCPGTPTGFLARAISTREIELSWQESSGNHTQYVIQRQDTLGSYQTVATVPSGTTFWEDAELLAGTIYYYRIYSEAGTQQSEKKYARARTFTPNENYVMETEVLTGGITDVTFVPNLNYDQRNSTWNYLNGLGGDMQTVVEGASPSQKDVVHPIIHDEFGLQSRQYLSYTIDQPTKPGNFRGQALQETLDFYATPPEGVAGTVYPWAETVFDSSPQNRVLEQASPGEDWEVSTGRTAKIDRTTNGVDEVLLWQLSGSSLIANNYYPARQLRKTVTVNEDDETVIVYEDMLGRELMRTVQLATSAITSYFVYNNRGSLLYRITPKVAETLSGPLPYTLDQNTLAQECYSYRYDDQERLIEEKWPDQEAIFYAYDEWDRLVLSQSGNQRLTHQWTFTKYDRFNRPILTGLMDTTVALTPAQMKAVVDAHYAKPSVSRFETYSGSVHGYTNESYPVRSDEQAYLSVTYYDNYDFVSDDPTFGAAYQYDATVLGCEPSPQGNYCFPSTPLKVLRGKVTGSRTRVLGRSQWLNGVVYYDEKGRTIQAVAQGHTGGIDRASTLHNFAGWPLATFSTMAAPTGDTYGIRRRFVYDHSGRLREGYHQLFKNGVGNSEKFLAENIYNELGQLMEKNLHIDQHLPLQSVDYRYNIRGWLESINNVRFSADSRNNDINDLFGMELIYQNMLNGVHPTTN